MTNEQKRLLEIDLCSRLPYGVKMKATSPPRRKPDMLVLGHDNFEELLCLKRKPVLFPISSLTREITIRTYNDGKPFVPIDYFEVTDDHRTCPIEQDYGNIKLIQDLKSIAENNVYFDCQFLPQWVTKLFNEWHLDWNGLIPQNIAISVETLESNPYA